MILIPRQQREMEHNKKILTQPEKTWGRSGEVGQLRVKKRANMIIDFCKINSAKRVLEIGCGTGILTQYLANTGANIVAVDIFPEFLEMAKTKIQANNITFEEENAEILKKFENENFDVVCGLSVLHHLDVDGALKNIRRVLKSNGYMSFSEPNMLNPQIALQKNIPFIKKWLGDSPDETAFLKWQIEKKLKKAGFDSVSVKPFDFLHPAAPDFVVPILLKLDSFLEKIPLIKEIAGSLFIVAKKSY